MISSFVFGARNYFEGLRYWVSRKALLAISSVSFVTSFFVFVFGMGYALSWVPYLQSRIMNEATTFLGQILYYLVRMGTVAAVLFLSFFALSVLINLLMLPVHDVLSERTLTDMKALTRQKDVSWFVRVGKNALTALRKAMFLLLAGLILLVLSLIPGLAPIVVVAGAFLLSWDLLDFSFDHLGMSFSERKQYLRRNFWEILGFSFGVGLTMAVPILNFFMLPGAVVSASHLVAKMKEK